MNCPTSQQCKFCKVKQCYYSPNFQEPIEETEREYYPDPDDYHDLKRLAEIESELINL